MGQLLLNGFAPTLLLRLIVRLLLLGQVHAWLAPTGLLLLETASAGVAILLLLLVEVLLVGRLAARYISGYLLGAFRMNLLAIAAAVLGGIVPRRQRGRVRNLSPGLASELLRMNEVLFVFAAVVMARVAAVRLEVVVTLIARHAPVLVEEASFVGGQLLRVL